MNLGDMLQRVARAESEGELLAAIAFNDESGARAALEAMKQAGAELTPAPRPEAWLQASAIHKRRAGALTPEQQADSAIARLATGKSEVSWGHLLVKMSRPWAFGLLGGQMGLTEKAALDQEARDCLDLACALGDERSVRALIAQGMDATGGAEACPMHHAARVGSVACAQALFEAGASPTHEIPTGVDPEIMGSEGKVYPYLRRGFQPIHMAAESGSEKMLAWLVERGASVDEPSGPLGRSPLHFAAQSKDGRAALWLLDHGAQNLVPEGETLMRLAAGSGNEPLASRLLSMGLGINEAGGDDGGTPLHQALSRGQIGMMLWLLDHGADPEARDLAGERPGEARGAPWDPKDQFVSEDQLKCLAALGAWREARALGAGMAQGSVASSKPRI